MAQSGRVSPRKVAFIDEYGAHGFRLDQPGVSGYFIVVAVLVDGERLPDARVALLEVCKKYQSIRSKTVGGNDQKRLRILEDLDGVPFRFFAVAVDKSEIWKTSGLIYKQSFYKFLSGQLYSRLYGSISDLEVIADSYGTESFMNSLLSYVEKRHRPDLFKPAPRFDTEDREAMLRLPDFIAGTLGRCFDPALKSPLAQGLRERLRRFEIGIYIWPPRRHSLDCSDSHSAAGDVAIRNVALEKAARYIANNSERAEGWIRARVVTVRYLLYSSEFDSPPRFVPTAELLEVLREEYGAGTSVHGLRSEIIGKLRDEDLLIASGPGGYKLPASERDLRPFLEHSSGIVEPLLGRIRRARVQVQLVTPGSVDLLSADRYRVLRGLVDAQSDLEERQDGPGAGG